MPKFDDKRGFNNWKPTIRINLEVNPEAMRRFKDSLQKSASEAVGKAIEDQRKGASPAQGPSAAAPSGGQPTTFQTFRSQAGWGLATGAVNAAAAALSGDRFESNAERWGRAEQAAVSRTAAAITGAGVEKATGSVTAGQLAGQGAGEIANALIERQQAPYRDIMNRARSSTMARYEDLAAAGADISDEQIQSQAKYELEKEKRREAFKKRSAELFNNIAAGDQRLNSGSLVAGLQSTLDNFIESIAGKFKEGTRRIVQSPRFEQ